MQPMETQLIIGHRPRTGSLYSIVVKRFKGVLYRLFFKSFLKVTTAKLLLPVEFVFRKLGPATRTQ